MMLPSPRDLGLPHKFSLWRPDQVPALDRILDAPERFVALAIPVGGGKSLPYMAAAHLSEGRAVVLTSTKGLQNQLVADFGEVGLFDIYGQSEYPCRALGPEGEFEHLYEHGTGAACGCDVGPCHVGMACTRREAGCAFYDAVREAKDTKLVTTNYAFWLAQSRYSQGLGDVDLLILDEAHAAVDALSDVLAIKYDKWLAQAVGAVPPWSSSPGIAAWANWGVYHQHQILSRLEHLPVGKSPGEMKYRRRLKQAAQILAEIAALSPGNWIEDHTPSEWQFQILDPSRYAEDLLFQGAKKVVFSSATLVPKTLALLGVGTEEVSWFECPSRFPVKNRTVWYVPTVKVDHRMTQAHVALWVARIDQILDQRPERKGIIHTVSYKRAEDVFAKSRHKKRMLLNTTGTIAKTVALFKQTTEPVVLVSPSVTTGYDFEGPQCRFQIIGKLPFPSTQGAIVKARQQVDPEYVPYLMTQTLQQTVGRAVRSETDWAETFVIDDNWAWVKGKYQHHFRGWFKEACKKNATIPAPFQP